MDSLLKQIAKFGVVGVGCFIIDFVVFTMLNAAFRRTGFALRFSQYYLLSRLVSVILPIPVSYLLSMRFVFERREDLSRRQEFILYAKLSGLGLLLSELILFVGMGLIDRHWTWFRRVLAFLADACTLPYPSTEETFWMLLSTGVVMCYSFLSRKRFLEDQTGSVEEKKHAD